MYRPFELAHRLTAAQRTRVPLACARLRARPEVDGQRAKTFHAHAFDSLSMWLMLKGKMSRIQPNELLALCAHARE
jgi:hypothetical protein